MALEAKSGSPVISAQQVQISGVWVDLYPIPKGEDGLDRGYGLDKRDAGRLMRHKLTIKARQIRASISSYGAELWAYHGPDGTLFGVSSLDNRMSEHVDRRDDSRRENGQKGGRPRKPAWDVTAGSSCLANQPVVETVTVEPHDPRPGDMWHLPAPAV
jgi:hypothetical protein